MYRVYFTLDLKTERGYHGPHWLIINAIQELIYPGKYNLDKRTLDRAEEYFGTEAWHMISSLGSDHNHPFIYHNGVVATWSNFTLNQLMSTRYSGSGQ